ncbi:MAG: TonB family protein [Prevotella sp.]|jgi:protein TonB|nr:TonB family protein [Prevotella sp.]MBQ8714820.1 TonB family protein [Prevotella sp.]
MEQKKTPQVDLEQQRTTGFLLGLVLVLAMLFVALEWNSVESVDDGATLDLDELVHEDEMIPMSVEEQLAQLEPDKSQPKEAEQLRIVDDNVEIQPLEEQVAEEEGDGDDETLLKELQGEEEPKAIAPMGIDPEDNPLMFRLVEDLPQYPGGAVEFMKWLTKNLRYPKIAQVRKTEGKVIANFYVEKDGSITGLKVVQSLSRECDREALRVLGMMPNWQPGVQNGKPCRTKVSIPIVFKL